MPKYNRLTTNYIVHTKLASINYSTNTKLNNHFDAYYLLSLVGMNHSKPNVGKMHDHQIEVNTINDQNELIVKKGNHNIPRSNTFLKSY